MDLVTPHPRGSRLCSVRMRKGLPRAVGTQSSSGVLDTATMIGSPIQVFARYHPSFTLSTMIIRRFWPNLALPALALLGLAMTLDAGEPLALASPDGTIELRIPTHNSSAEGGVGAKDARELRRGEEGIPDRLLKAMLKAMLVRGGLVGVPEAL